MSVFNPVVIIIFVSTVQYSWYAIDFLCKCADKKSFNVSDKDFVRALFLEASCAAPDPSPTILSLFSKQAYTLYTGIYIFTSSPGSFSSQVDSLVFEEVGVVVM